VDLSGCGQGAAADWCKYGKEGSCSIKDGKRLDQLSDNQFLKTVLVHEVSYVVIAMDGLYCALSHPFAGES
jgi:hypothetical protein